MTTSVDAGATTRPRFLDSWRLPVVLFVVVGALLAVIVQTSHDHLPPDQPHEGADISDAAYYGGWMQFDSGWYVYIAEHGYDDQQVAAFDAGQQSAVAYFPLYPLTVREVARVTGDDHVLAAELTTVLSGLAVAVLFWLWCGRRLSARARRLALAALLLYPYAWYLYGSGYGDAFFIMLTISAFLLLERERPVLAGLFGAAASAARLIGVGTIIGLVALTIERRGALTRTPTTEPRRPWSGWRLDRSRLRARDSGVLLSVGGIAGYATFLWARTGDPFAFNTVQAAPGWNQGAGPKTWFKYSFFAEVLKDSPSYSGRLVLQASLALLCAAAVWFIARRFGPSYAIYTAVLVLIPLVGSSTFQGFGRYSLSAFPVFAVAGALLDEHLSSSRVRRFAALGLVVMVGLLFTQASFFGRGYYLS